MTNHSNLEIFHPNQLEISFIENYEFDSVELKMLVINSVEVMQYLQNHLEIWKYFLMKYSEKWIPLSLAKFTSSSITNLENIKDQVSFQIKGAINGKFYPATLNISIAKEKLTISPFEFKWDNTPVSIVGSWGYNDSYVWIDELANMEDPIDLFNRYDKLQKEVFDRLKKEEQDETINQIKMTPTHEKLIKAFQIKTKHVFKDFFKDREYVWDFLSKLYNIKFIYQSSKYSLEDINKSIITIQTNPNMVEDTTLLSDDIFENPYSSIPYKELIYSPILPLILAGIYHELFQAEYICDKGYMDSIDELYVSNDAITPW